jgi:serine/threonine protein phosphatase PrpC
MNIHSAIVKGPNKSSIQDALSIVNKKDFCLIAIADGLGSYKYSEYGSKIAVIAVEKAINQWRNLRKENVKVLIQLIHCFWNLLIGDSEFEKKECLTTCLFSYIDYKKKKIILGQLGDGLIYFNSNEETVFMRSSEEYNFTKSLGNSNSINEWNIKSFNYKELAFSLLVVTDGISEDIVENKEKEFVEYIIQKLLKLKKNQRNAYLKNLLESWPTKFHNDDKTICIVWE